MPLCSYKYVCKWERCVLPDYFNHEIQKLLGIKISPKTDCSVDIWMNGALEWGSVWPEETI